MVSKFCFQPQVMGLSMYLTNVLLAVKMSSVPSEFNSTSNQPSPLVDQSSPLIDSSQPQTQDDTNEVEMGEEELESKLANNKLRSVVWQHFKKVKIDGVWKAVCNYCTKKLLGESKSGTKHLHNQYKICPQRRVVESKQKVLTQDLFRGEGKRKLDAYTFDQEFARRQLAKMIILHEYPLSIVEHVGFKMFSQAIQPSFKMVSRNTIKGDILSIYNFERIKTVKLIEKNRSRVAFTTDMWTSSNQKKGYMVVMAHFIDDA